MNRRAFLTIVGGSILAAPLAVEAPEAAKVPRVGYILPLSARQRNEPFWEGLRELGDVEGRNIVTVPRYAEGRSEHYPELARELVQLGVDVIVSDGTQATLAARQATTRTPIVMIAGNPLSLGLIASLAKPGGNITGLSTNSPELVGKRLQLVKDAFPQVTRLAVLFNALSPVSESFVRESEVSAQALRLQIERAPVRSGADLEGAFAALVSKHLDAVLVIEDPTLFRREMGRITQLAVKHRLLTVVGVSSYVRDGALMSYGANFDHMFRRTAFYVDRILKGAKPGELPVEEPTKFELVINLKTAKALGLTIPQSLLLRADQITE
jgi:putative tryptophan/tyrosine transport system substrate-binding protein